MAAGRRGLLQRLDGLVEAGVDVGLAVGIDPGDLRLDVLEAAERRRLDDPVGRLVERDDPELVLGAQRRGRAQDGLLADVDLAHAAGPARPAAHAAVEAVAVAGVHRARLVDDDDERDVRLLLPVADAHVDGQRRLERRVGIAAGAVAARPADHHEPPPEVAHVGLERGHRLVAEAQPGHVDQHDRVVVGEAGEVGRDRLGDDRVDDLLLGLAAR